MALLENKTVLLGVTGGIAAYKSATLASLLVKEGATVHVLMTENAKNFINPITFETLTGNKCITDTFDRDFEFQVEHVSLAKQADMILVAPATANVIAKLAHGIADDMLTTTILASAAPKLIAPAMNTGMYENPVTQDNLKLLEKYGMTVIPPDSGRLACGDTGVGKLPEPKVLLEYVLMTCACEKDLAGKNVLVTAGPTQEPLDPVRYLTNHSSGKMGYALARACALRGAHVTLVSGKTDLTPPLGVDLVPVVTAREMADAVLSRSEAADLILMAAAVADYRPALVADEKIKKSDDDLTLPLTRTTDILAALGAQKKPGQFLCGFCMETENLLENAKEKLTKKNLDMIVANNLKEPGAGFETDTNVVTILTPGSAADPDAAAESGTTADPDAVSVTELPQLSKDEVAQKILDLILQKWSPT